MSLDAIGIVSQDLARSVAFYQLLGIELQPKGSPEHLEGSTTSGVRIMVDSVGLTKMIHPDWEQPSGSGVALCFVQSSPQEVNGLHAKVVAAGFRSKKAPWDAFWGQRYCSVVDPDGNQIDLFATL